MDEAGEKLKRAFTGAFALLFAVIVLCAVFCNQNVFGTQSPRSLLAGGLALAVGVLCAAWLLRLLPAPGKRLRRTLLAAFFTLCFLAQAHVGRALVVGATGDWDFGIVLRAALDFAADGAQGGIYFNNFPNNQPLMLLLAGLFRLLRACGVTEEYELLVWGMRFGAVLLQLALFFLYLCAARLLGRRAGALALLLGAATEPFLLYAPVYYTDTVTAPIPIAILYCWLRLRAARREGRPGRGPLAAVFVLGVLGTLLKVTVVIMVIVVVLDWMISFPKLRERLAALALLAAVVAGVNAGSFAAAHSGAFRKAQPGDEIPKTHWIMMGLAGNGGYNNEDYVLTFSAPDGETRKALIRDEIAARLKEMGPAGLVRHALDKIGYTWGEGTYYLPHKLAMGPTQPHSFWAEIFFEGRAHFSLFLRYANGLMLCMLLYLLAGALQKQSRDVLFAARLSVCGLFFFLLIWEARSRYLVNYVPVLLLLFAAAAWGMAGRLPGWAANSAVQAVKVYPDEASVFGWSKGKRPAPGYPGAGRFFKKFLAHMRGRVSHAPARRNAPACPHTCSRRQRAPARQDLPGRRRARLRPTKRRSLFHWQGGRGLSRALSRTGPASHPGTARRIHHRSCGRCARRGSRRAVRLLSA